MEAIRIAAAAALQVRANEVKAEVNVNIPRDGVVLRIEAVKPSLDHEAVTALAELVKLHGLEVNIRPDFDRQALVVEIYKKGAVLCSERATE